MAHSFFFVLGKSLFYAIKILSEIGVAAADRLVESRRETKKLNVERSLND